MSDDTTATATIDTTAAPAVVQPGRPGRPGTSFVAGRTAEPLPVGPPAADACRYYLSTRNGKVYAVELREGWIPVRVAGSFGGEQLRREPHEQDWSGATDAREWNLATLVPLCEPERARMIAGLARSFGRPAAASGRVPLPGRRLTDAPTAPTT